MDKKKIHIITIPEDEWQNSEYRSIVWESSVNIIRWIHDYMNEEYQISYQDIWFDSDEV